MAADKATFRRSEGPYAVFTRDTSQPLLCSVVGTPREAENVERAPSADTGEPASRSLAPWAFVLWAAAWWRLADAVKKEVQVLETGCGRGAL